VVSHFVGMPDIESLLGGSGWRTIAPTASRP
jgi:hypothetical protein